MVAMIKLYGSSNNKSFNTLKLRFALAEIGAAYDFVPVDLPRGESRTADFLRINPHGKVPVLVDGDFALPESGAILWYLGESYPDAKLLPRADGTAAALQARAQILRFNDLAATAFYPAYSEWWNATSSDDPGKRNLAATTLWAFGKMAAPAVPKLTTMLADPDPAMRSTAAMTLENIGAEASLSSPEAFGRLIAEEVSRWREVAKAAGLEAQ